MNSQQFREAALEMAKFIANYRDNVANMRVLPNLPVGYLASLIPKTAPFKGESWSTILKDMESKIMPGITHWTHPNFHAYFPAAATYPGILGDMIAAAIGSNGTSWSACPAATELESITMDWLARALGLPEHFIFSEPNSTGGGIQLTSASEAILISMLAARSVAVQYLREKAGSPSDNDSRLISQLVAYTSKEAHSSVEKAAMIAVVRLRVLETDDQCALRGFILQKAIDEDIAQGLHPFYVAATLGTTSCTSFDNIKEIGYIVTKLPACWLHCDGAYGGSSFICPELRGPMDGMEYADSFNCNPNKWLLINFDCSCLWVKDRSKLSQSLMNGTLYHTQENEHMEYRHWGIQLGRKFRALKVWVSLRSYGKEALQEYIRNHCALAQVFLKYVSSDRRFEVVTPVMLGLVCFRLIGKDYLTEKLLHDLNASGLIHMVPSKINEKFWIRFVVCYEDATENHIKFAWKLIQETSTQVIAEDQMCSQPPLSETLTFTKEVPQELYESRRKSLPDFSMPIAVTNYRRYSDAYMMKMTYNKVVVADEEGSETDDKPNLPLF